ncbi:MAG: hypothetical protein ACXWX0_02575 [Actinomycetota bacterium]
MRTRTISISAITVVLALSLASCTGDGDGADGGATGTPSAAPPITPVASPPESVPPTPPALPEDPPPRRGSAALDCVNGWVTPPSDSSRFLQPLGIIRRTTGVAGPLEVVDMRVFEGPESPPSDKGYLLVVERWYVKLYARDDLSFQGRFLVEARTFGRGLAAVAPYDTNGFRSPDWIGFQFDSADPETRAYEGLPGLWAGVPYDFVEGGAGLSIPGLPDEVSGCLAGT